MKSLIIMFSCILLFIADCGFCQKLDTNIYSKLSNYLEKSDMELKGEEKYKIEEDILSQYGKKNGYISPDYNTFKEQCNYLLGVDLDSTKDDIILFNSADGFEIFKTGRFIKTFPESLFYQPWVDGDVKVRDAIKMIENDDNGIGREFVAVNKLLFSNDKNKELFFENNIESCHTAVLVFDYEESAHLISKVAEYECRENIDGYFADIKWLLFYNNHSRGFKKQLLLSLYNECIKNKNTVAYFDNLMRKFCLQFAELPYSVEVKDSCMIYLIELMLDFDKRDGITQMELYSKKAYSHLSNFLSVDRNLLLRIAERMYYNNVDIKHLILNYCTNTYEHFTVYDIDGYSNLRKAPQGNSSIVTQVESGSVVMKISTTDNWCHVITLDGFCGYMHKSRLVWQK